MRGVASVGHWGGKWVRGLDWERWGLAVGAVRFVSGAGIFGGASDSDGEWPGCAGRGVAPEWWFALFGLGIDCFGRVFGVWTSDLFCPSFLLMLIC